MDMSGTKKLDKLKEGTRVSFSAVIGTEEKRWEGKVGKYRSDFRMYEVFTDGWAVPLLLPRNVLTKLD